MRPGRNQKDRMSERFLPGWAIRANISPLSFLAVRKGVVPYSSFCIPPRETDFSRIARSVAQATDRGQYQLGTRKGASPLLRFPQLVSSQGGLTLQSTGPTRKAAQAGDF